jgi:hypothetical protein
VQLPVPPAPEPDDALPELPVVAPLEPVPEPEVPVLGGVGSEKHPAASAAKAKRNGKDEWFKVVPMKVPRLTRKNASGRNGGTSEWGERASE